MFVQSSASVLTVAVNDNVLSGNQFEFSPINGVVELGLVGSATGFEIDVLAGNRTVVTRMLPNIQNRFPVFPDDFVVSFGVLRGDRIVLRARNISGGTLTLFYCLRFNPA